MAQFRFSLEKALRWRAVELTREEAQLQRVLQEKNRLLTAEARLAGERASLGTSLDHAPEIRGEDLRTLAIYSLRLRRQRENLAQARARCERDLAIQQKKYSAAKLRLRLLEQLKARQLERWQYDQARQLESFASDSYLAGWNRAEE